MAVRRPRFGEETEGKQRRISAGDIDEEVVFSTAARIRKVTKIERKFS